MKLTICGSMTFFDEMLNIKANLEAQGHTVLTPTQENSDYSGLTQEEQTALKKNILICILKIFEIVMR